MVLWVSLHSFCYNVFYLCSTLSFHFCKHFPLSILGNYIWKQDLSVPHSCPGVYKRINCIRKVSTRNAHGHHLKWYKKVNTIRAASVSGRPADFPKSIFCRASVLLTFLRALWEMCKWPIRPLNVMQNDLRATSDKNTSFNTSKNLLYVKSGFQVIETQHWKTDNYLPKFKLRERTSDSSKFLLSWGITAPKHLYLYKFSLRKGFFVFR